MPADLNWWIGVVFALGSLFFALASLLSLSPELAVSWHIEPSSINALFFTGSVLFTTAAYLQLFQAANATRFDTDNVRSGRSVSLFGWRPRDIGWLSCALQFMGTVLFNVNTFDAMATWITWLEQDLLVWVPDILGSTLFLLSGYLAFIETCHAHWGWRPASVSWWVVFVNLLGCVGFMASAVLAIAVPGSDHDNMATWSLVFTLQGAVCFLVGSLLMLPEAALHSGSGLAPIGTG